MQQFFNSLEDKIELCKLCSNLFAGEAKLHEKIAQRNDLLVFKLL